MSNYTNLTDKSLRVIIFTLNNAFDENNIDIEGNNIFEEYIVDLIDKTLEYFGIKDQSVEMYSYFISLCLLNPSYLDKNVPIQRPKLNDYEVIHGETSKTWKTTTYRTVIPSYIELDKNMIADLTEIELYDYWDGVMISDYTDDNEMSDEWVEEIKMIRK